jgi:uncharacterized membrane protein
MSRLRRYAPFYIAVLCGLAMLALALWLFPHLAVQSAANAFFVVYIVLEFMKFPGLTPQFLKKHAASTDEPAWIIVVVTFGAVMFTVARCSIWSTRAGGPMRSSLRSRSPPWRSVGFLSTR